MNQVRAQPRPSTSRSKQSWMQLWSQTFLFARTLPYQLVTSKSMSVHGASLPSATNSDFEKSHKSPKGFPDITRHIASCPKILPKLLPENIFSCMMQEWLIEKQHVDCNVLKHIYVLLHELALTGLTQFQRKTTSQRRDVIRCEVVICKLEVRTQWFWQ